MGYCCIIFDDGTRYCYSGLSESSCSSFPRGAGTYYETQQQCQIGCNLQGPGGGAGGGGGGGGTSIQCFDYVTRSECTGTFTPNVLCSSNPCDDGGGGGTGPTGPNNSVGICCKNGTCLLSASTEEECKSECGNWLSTYSYFFTSQNGEYQNERVTYQFGSSTTDCQICALGRPFFDFIDSGSCWPIPRFRKVSLSDLNYSNNPNLNNKCCNYVIADANIACSDLLYNQYGFEPVLISQGSNTPREGLLELLTCPLTDSATNSIFHLAEQVYEEWKDAGYVNPINSDCPGDCCKCFDDGGEICVSAGSVSNICGIGQIMCPPGYQYGHCNSGDGGPVLGGGGGGVDPGPPPANLVCLDDYCDTNPYYACSDCPNSTLLDSGIKKVKMYLNSTDFICVEISCSDCSNYELCEET